MKLATFTYDGCSRIGAVSDNDIVDLQRAYARYLREAKGDGAAERIAGATFPNDMVALLERYAVSGEAAEQALLYAQGLPDQEPAWQARVRYKLDEVRLERPLVPQTIMAAGPRPTTPGAKLYPFSEFYIKPPTAVIGPEEAVVTQPNIAHLLPEAELGIIFAGGGRHVSPEEALNNIFGYTIFLDLIDAERLIFGWEGTTMFHTRYGEGASFDTSGVLGPWIVTRDELPDVDNVSIKLYINEKLQVEYRPVDLWRSIAEYSSYLSTFFPLEPKILGTSGVPYGATYGPDAAGDPHITAGGEVRPVTASDRIVAQIDGIGRLETQVMDSMVKGAGQ
ncbi:MAG: fumarylacetoacetate hydrolase family protein [Anaerolineae bacterium]